MLNIVDIFATAWLNWRTHRKHIRELKTDELFQNGTLTIEAEGSLGFRALVQHPAVYAMCNELAAVLETLGASHYLVFEFMPRIDKSPNAMHVTIQRVGAALTPARHIAILQEELATERNWHKQDEAILSEVRRLLGGIDIEDVVGEIRDLSNQSQISILDTIALRRDLASFLGDQNLSFPDTLAGEIVDFLVKRNGDPWPALKWEVGDMSSPVNFIHTPPREEQGASH